MANDPWLDAVDVPGYLRKPSSRGAFVRKDRKPPKSGVQAPAMLRDTPALAVARRQPSFDDYVKATAGAIKRAPEGGVRVGKALSTLAVQAAPSVAQYLSRNGLAQMGYDALSGGASLVKDFAAAHPVRLAHAASDLAPYADFATDMLPFVGDAKALAQGVSEAATKRAQGDLEGAHEAEGLVLPTTLMGLVPEAGGLAVKGLRGARGLVRDAARETPRFNVSEEGPFLNVKRTALEPQIVPEALAAPNLAAIRKITADPERNQALRLANDLSVEQRGVPLDERRPFTSLRRQSGIARAHQLAVEGSPEYKHAVFEAYGNRMPEVVGSAQNYDQLTENAYRALGEHVDKQFSQLPVRTRYHYGEGEYPTPSAMMRDVLGNGDLNVFRGGDRHDFLNRIDPETGLNENEKFRAVHDYIGHVATGSTFRPGGEEIAYAAHHNTLPPLARLALLAETRGQNSLVNYSPLNADLLAQMKPLQGRLEMLGKSNPLFVNKAEVAGIRQQLRDLGAQTQYAPQNALLLPPEYLDPLTEGGIPDWLRALIKPKFGTEPERAVHLSHTEGLTATDPSFYGTGHRGDDWRMRGAAGSPENKTSFYLGPEGTVRPERMVADVSPYAYEGEVSGLYDIAQDPEKLVKLARAYNDRGLRAGKAGAYLPDLVRMIHEGGYSGYRNPNFLGDQGAADVFGPVDNLRAITRGDSGYARGGLAVR